MRIIRTEAEMEERRLRRRAIRQELRAENLVRRAVRAEAIDAWLTTQQQLAPAITRKRIGSASSPGAGAEQSTAAAFPLTPGLRL